MSRVRLVPVLIVALVVIAAVFAAVTAQPASAYKTVPQTACNGCHSAAPSGAVTAAPSTTAPAAGTTYTVSIDIGLTAAGDNGFWISNSAGTNVTGNNSTVNPRTATMAAPATAGTYTYTVWTAKGPGSSGMARSTTYTITVPAPTAAVPVLRSLSPASGLAGSSVTITGTNLGTSGVVSFSGTAAATTSWTATSINATVPAGLGAGAQGVVVTPAGATASNSLPFTVTTPAPAPAITTLTPNHGLVGSSVVIAGSNLGTSAGTVRFGSTTATITAWGTSSVTATVPNGAGAQGVVVTPAGATASNSLPFTVTTPAPATPAITTLTPNHGLVGSSVVIAGSNLGTSAGTVRFGSTTATITAWGTSSVTATVPNVAGTVNVTVTPAGTTTAASGSPTYTVDTPAPAAPVLSTLSPTSGLAGSSVTITGTDLGIGGTVRFGTVVATVTPGTWTATRIVVTVPNVAGGSQPVTVTPAGAAASNGLTYTVTTRAPDGTDKTPPTTTATGATPNGWYDNGVTIRLTATDNVGGSGVASITYSVDGGAPVTVKGSTATVTISAESAADDHYGEYDHDGADEGSRDGAHVVAYYATDSAGNAEAAQALRFNIDTQKPTTKAPSPVKAKRYHTATLKYQVNDATPNGGTAKVIIAIKDSRGNVVKMRELGKKPVNTPLAASFRCSLRPGTYTFCVYATDTAGNRQANVAKNTLKVYSGS